MTLEEDGNCLKFLFLLGMKFDYATDSLTKTVWDCWGLESSIDRVITFVVDVVESGFEDNHNWD